MKNLTIANIIDSASKNRSYNSDNINNRRKYIDIIVKRIKEIANEKSITDKNQLKKEIICVRQLLQAVYTVMVSYTNMKGIAFRLQVNEDLYLKGDLSKIKQVCFNLVKNAAEAIQHNYGEIFLSCYSENKYVVIEVEDNGIGMDQTEVERMGEPFYTNKESGTGLGVMVTKSIIHEHNGLIDFESIKNQGTKVRVKLPKEERDLMNCAKK